MGLKSRYERLSKLSDGPFPALTIRYAQGFLADYPDHGPAWLLLGIALIEVARYDEAKQAILKSMDCYPAEKRQIPLAQMGHLFMESGAYDEAAAWYRQAIQCDPDDATYHIFLGAVVAKQGRLEEAEVSHRTAIACAEGCIDEAYLNLGLVLRAQERFDEAADCFREAIRRDPQYRIARQALRDVERCMKWCNRRQGGS
ncbi:MAG TPA: tetratricopeptide repeat protein [Lacipirellulaceae bacterium]